MNSNQREALRRKSLGELGELVAIKALVDAKYTRISNLNDHQINFPFADLYAQKGKNRLVISVKARNKHLADGKLNSRYKLGSKAMEHAQAAEKEFKAQAFWMAVQFDYRSFSIYLGSMEELNGNLGIPIRKCMNGEIGQCLAADKRHYFDFRFFTNNSGHIT